MRQPLISQIRSLATDRWARAGVRTLLRAAWLGACVWCVGLGGRLLLGWPLRPELLDVIALAILGVAVASLLRPRLAPREAARRLDRRFRLDEQLATAIEIAATNPAPGTLADRLVTQSEQTARQVGQRIARQQRPPWNELITLVAVALVALGLYALTGIGRADFQVSASALPPLAAPPDPAQQFPDEPPAPDQQQSLIPDPNGQPAPGDQGASGDQGSQGAPGDQGAPSASGAADPAVARALADALRNQGATRPAAEALDRGDPSGAAQRLRELADQADQLGQAARNDLADALRDAADQIAPRNPALADQVRRSADGLQSGGQDASKALDDLAQAIEQTQADPSAQGQGPGQGEGQGQGQGEGQGQAQGGGQDQGQGQGQGDGQGQGGGAGGSGADGAQRQADPSDRLGVEGQPLPLEAEGDELGPPQPSDKPPTSSDVVPGFVHGDASSDKPVSTGEDPLRVPLDERDVVQGYFTP